MVYNPEIPFDVESAKTKLTWLIKNKKPFELTEKRKMRTPSQNNYLHLILSWYALEYGETLKYIKEEVFKAQINKDIFEYEFVNEKTGECRMELRSSSTLNTKEMTVAIERFRNYASKEAGIYLPEPQDLAMLEHIKNTIKNNTYL